MTKRSSVRKEGGKKQEEPTLGEFYEFVRDGFKLFEQKFDSIDQRFDAVGQRFDAVDQRFDLVEENMLRLHEGQAELTHEFGNLSRRVGRLELQMEDVQETVHTLNTSVNRSLETLDKHEKRIVHLEKRALA